VISAATRARIDAEVARFPAPRGALLAALHWVQTEHGHISDAAMRELAELFGLHPVEVMEVVSFYNLFFTTPQPRHHAYVCTNLPCSLRGARPFLADLQVRLGVDAEGNTPDGRLHLSHEECLGACGNAPMLRVDETYHEDLDVEKACRILESLD